MRIFLLALAILAQAEHTAEHKAEHTVGQKLERVIPKAILNGLSAVKHYMLALVGEAKDAAHGDVATQAHGIHQAAKGEIGVVEALRAVEDLNHVRKGVHASLLEEGDASKAAAVATRRLERAVTKLHDAAAPGEVRRTTADVHKDEAEADMDLHRTEALIAKVRHPPVMDAERSGAIAHDPLGEGLSDVSEDAAALTKELEADARVTPSSFAEVPIQELLAQAQALGKEPDAASRSQLGAQVSFGDLADEAASLGRAASQAQQELQSPSFLQLTPGELADRERSIEQKTARDLAAVNPASPSLTGPDLADWGASSLLELEGSLHELEGTVELPPDSLLQVHETRALAQKLRTYMTMGKKAALIHQLASQAPLEPSSLFESFADIQSLIHAIPHKKAVPSSLLQEEPGSLTNLHAAEALDEVMRKQHALAEAASARIGALAETGASHQSLVEVGVHHEQLDHLEDELDSALQQVQQSAQSNPSSLLETAASGAPSSWEETQAKVRAGESALDAFMESNAAKMRAMAAGASVRESLGSVEHAALLETADKQLREQDGRHQ